MNPEVKEALRAVRASMEQMKKAMSDLTAASVRATSTVEKLVAIQGVYAAVETAREAQDGLLAVMEAEDGAGPVVIEATFQELDS